MTGFKIHKLPFDQRSLASFREEGEKHQNWPVVYTLNDNKEIYIGETVNAVSRLTQHLASAEKIHLNQVQIIFNDTFNKSACLDLESRLIQYFAADEKFKVLNRNNGISEANYFDKDHYSKSFEVLYAELVKNGMLTRSIPEIINSSLFKYSPFKALNVEQSVAVEEILGALFQSLKANGTGSFWIQGDPGTGKTIVAIYLLKLLADIRGYHPHDLVDEDSMFSQFFTPSNAKEISDFQMAFVIPQSSLRETLNRVFKQTPGLSPKMILSPFEVGSYDGRFDLLVIDEAHRLSRRANQPSAAQNKLFSEINLKLFGSDDLVKTQLDWILAKSNHQIFLVDTEQAVRPADLGKDTLVHHMDRAKNQDRYLRLHSQMRVKGGDGYLDFVNALFSDKPQPLPEMENYEFKFFDNLADMQLEIIKREEDFGLSRLVAGYAWEWKSRTDKSVIDIDLDGTPLTWNRVSVDWINNSTAKGEVGCIHTVQGYDLNYAGVIIGNDLLLNPATNQLEFVRANYFDAKGKEDNPRLGIKFSDEELLDYVKNIYKVLLTRGIKGTFVYITNPELRKRISSLI